MFIFNVLSFTNSIFRPYNDKKKKYIFWIKLIKIVAFGYSIKNLTTTNYEIFQINKLNVYKYCFIEREFQIFSLHQTLIFITH